jgi:hypothetical protein
MSYSSDSIDQLMQSPAVVEVAPKPLTLGGTIECPVVASNYWNRTGVLLEPGTVYELQVKGAQIWYDDFVRADADGFEWMDVTDFLSRLVIFLTQPLRRSPFQKLFALIGAIGQNEIGSFLIGHHREYRPLFGGELCCYANDVPGCYENNRGHLILSVTRIK